jgi:hypothetical protein
MPGANNDINILDCSPFFHYLNYVTGRYRTVSYKYMERGCTLVKAPFVYQ